MRKTAWPPAIVGVLVLACLAIWARTADEAVERNYCEAQARLVSVGMKRFEVELHLPRFVSASDRWSGYYARAYLDAVGKMPQMARMLPFPRFESGGWGNGEEYYLTYAVAPQWRVDLHYSRAHKVARAFVGGSESPNDALAAPPVLRQVKSAKDW